VPDIFAAFYPTAGKKNMRPNKIQKKKALIFFTMPPHVPYGLRGLPSGWDAHEAQLRCPDEVDGDI
jgi:hypothetical protein